MADFTTGLCNIQLEAETGGVRLEIIILQRRANTVGPDIRPLSDYCLDDDTWSNHGEKKINWSLVLQNGKLGPQNCKIWKIITILQHLVNFLYTHPCWIIGGKDERRWRVASGWEGGRLSLGWRCGLKRRKYKNNCFIIRLASTEFYINFNISLGCTIRIQVTPETSWKTMKEKNTYC